jgi:hypothetical protein
MMDDVVKSTNYAACLAPWYLSVRSAQTARILPCPMAAAVSSADYACCFVRTAA